MKTDSAKLASYPGTLPSAIPVKPWNKVRSMTSNSEPTRVTWVNDTRVILHQRVCYSTLKHEIHLKTLFLK